MRRSSAAATKPARFNVTHTLVEWARSLRPRQQGAAGFVDPFKLPVVPPGVAPSKASGMAMDDVLCGWGSGTSPGGWAYSQLANSFGGLYGGALTHFIGYPELAVLAQKPEYRKAIHVFATEPTRRWIKISATNDGKEGSGKDEDKSDKIAQLNDAMDRFKVRDVFREALVHDGQFGRGHIFIELANASDEELKTPIGNGRNDATKAKVTKGSLKAIRTVEPMWVYPTGYNSTDPLKEDWYKPQSWLVMGKPVHATRLLTLVSREVPDILKPAYMFGGLSLTQMMMPYVNRWEKTAKSVSDLVRAFTVWVLKANLSTVLQGDELERRVSLFELLHENRGVMLVDKDTEDFGNISANLSTLDKLQAQAQEQMASIVSIPLVKYLGITPSGLNASSDGEIRVFYDDIKAGPQEHVCSQPLDTIFAMIQLNEFGQVDPDLTYSFEPLWELNEKEQAEVDEIRARTAQTHIDVGVISPMEERQRVAADPDSPYTALDVDDMPETPLEPDDDLDLAPEREADEGGAPLNGAAPHDRPDPGRLTGRRANA